MSKEKKKILITGASRGIGKDIALKSKERSEERSVGKECRYRW